MAGLEINCPNCGSGEFELVEAGRHQCVFCRTLYSPPAVQGSGSFPGGRMPEKVPDPLRPPPQVPPVVYVQPLPPKVHPALRVVQVLIFLAGVVFVIAMLVSMFSDSKKFGEQRKHFDDDKPRQIDNSRPGRK